MKEKTLELKKIIELIKQNTYEKKNKRNTIPEALISTKEKHMIKEEPIQRMERFGTRPKNKKKQFKGMANNVLQLASNICQLVQFQKQIPAKIEELSCKSR